MKTNNQTDGEIKMERDRSKERDRDKERKTQAKRERQTHKEEQREKHRGRKAQRNKHRVRQTKTETKAKFVLFSLWLFQTQSSSHNPLDQQLTTQTTP